MTMHGRFDMPSMRGAISGRAGQTGVLVILKNIDAIGVRLAISLLEAGYRVLGVNVSAECREAFERGGGLILTGDMPGNVTWIIECRTQSNPNPEVLSRIAAGRSAYGRPRVELTGAQRSQEGSRERAVASLAVKPFDDPGSALRVDLGVTLRGPELSVRGERSLFEKALPLLTALSDRVLYNASGRDQQA